jgi:hypothetical protein
MVGYYIIEFLREFIFETMTIPQFHSVTCIECCTGMDWACFWASLPDQAEKKILKIKDFIKDFT